MDSIRELLARLIELTTEELDTLRSQIVDEFDGTEGNTPEAVAAMQELADALTSVKAEQGQRAETEAQAERDGEEARARMKALLDDSPVDAEVDGDEPVVVVDEVDNEEAPEVVAPTGAPVLAAGSPVSGRAARMTKSGSTAPLPVNPRAINVMAALTASGSLRGGGINPGDAITDRWTLAEAMCETLRRMPRNGSPRGDVIVASARYEYPESRRLGTDPVENERKIMAATGLQALVATGGICSPVNVDYGVPTWASTERPLKSSLPSFQTDRGGLTFVTPPSIANLAAATTVWTAANDATPTAPTTKPVLVVPCGTPQTVLVNAIPTRLQFGNMEGRFAPEQVAANTDLAIAMAARIAELELLLLMDASSTPVSTAQYLGATRDILATVDLAAAGYRYRQRIAKSQMLTAVFPEWAQGLFRADMARQLAVQDSPLQIPDAMINGWFSARNINVIWTLDGRPAKATGIAYSAQQFAPQVTGPLNPWPNATSHVQVVWNLFVEGTMQVLDGGQLDLGIVRDSTLDATNDYETFIEPFEGLAFRGIEALLCVSTVNPNGTSGGTTAPSATIVS